MSNKSSPQDDDEDDEVEVSSPWTLLDLGDGASACNIRGAQPDSGAGRANNGKGATSKMS